MDQGMDSGLETRRGGYFFPIALGLSLAVHAIVLWLPKPAHLHSEEERLPLRAELRPAAPLPVAEAVPMPPPPRPQPLPKPSQQKVLTQPTPAAAPSVAAPEPSPPQDRREAAPVPSQPAPAPAAPAAKEPAPVVQPGYSAAYLSNPKPPYPLVSRRRGETGTVYLKVLVTREGLPGKVELDRSSGSDALDKSALETVRHWRFTPGSQGGEAVEGWVRVPIDFRLEGQ